MGDMRIEYHDPRELRPYENNARAHRDLDIEAIRASIREFGFNDPIGIWSDDNLIVEGHGRQMAAIEEGITSVPCIRLDHLTDEQRRAYALAHNKTAELSAWDFGVLNAELAGIKEIDMEALGFEAVQPVEAIGDEYDFDSESVEPVVQRGQIWVLGDHRLMCGDSADESDMEILLGGGRHQDGVYGPALRSEHRRQEQDAR